jgi:hypothetical protein
LLEHRPVFPPHRIVHLSSFDIGKKFLYGSFNRYRFIILRSDACWFGNGRLGRLYRLLTRGRLPPGSYHLSFVPGNLLCALAKEPDTFQRALELDRALALLEPPAQFI